MIVFYFIPFCTSLRRSPCKSFYIFVTNGKEVERGLWIFFYKARTFKDLWGSHSVWQNGALWVPHPGSIFLLSTYIFIKKLRVLFQQPQDTEPITSVPQFPKALLILELLSLNSWHRRWNKPVVRVFSTPGKAFLGIPIFFPKHGPSHCPH